MQSLERAAAVFCTACVCAELLSRFVGPGWGHKCIKAVAGLYILIVFLDALPGAKAQLEAIRLPPVEAVSVGNLESSILAQTEAELARTLAAQCQAQTGAAVTLTITLVSGAEGVEASRVQVSPEQALEPAQRQAVEHFLEEQLQLGAECIVWRSPGEEDVL